MGRLPPDEPDPHSTAFVRSGAVEYTPVAGETSAEGRLQNAGARRVGPGQGPLVTVGVVQADAHAFHRECVGAGANVGHVSQLSDSAAVVGGFEFAPGGLAQ